MKLIPMVEFVLKADEIEERLIKIAEKLDRYELVVDAQYSFSDKVKAYAKFLNQPLTLGMFVPCDESNNIVKEPDLFNYHINIPEISLYELKLKEYQEAKDRVLFEGWELVSNGKWGAEIARCKITGNNQFNITKFLNVDHLLTAKQLFLTESAKKQIGL